MNASRLSIAAAALLLAACAPAPGPSSSASSSSSAAAAVFSAGGSQSPASITVAQPAPGATVASPLTVSGVAAGWYFEASFPVRLLDASGNEIAVAPAQAQGDWMTADPVPFLATLTFVTSSQTGTLVLEKDNPSGEPQHDASVRIPVQF